MGWMLLFWRWREMYCGYSYEESNQVCEVLAKNQIQYVYKAKTGHTGVLNGDRMRFGTFGENPAYLVMQYIYVRKKDAEYAQFLLNKG